MSWLLLAGGMGLLLTYEIYAAVKNQPKDDPRTISQLVWDASKDTATIPFMFGFLMGHFFAR